MDTVRRIVPRGNQKGMVLVFVAFALMVLCVFVALAVDMGYMYVARGQLQNAADAAALAGASALKANGPAPADPNDLVQLTARNRARDYASSNKAAGVSVTIASDNSNELTIANDITVGHWDGSNYAAGVKPVNAIQARARRTANSPDKEVGLFFANIVGIESMGASAEAVAGLPLKATNYFAFCIQACGGHKSDRSHVVL